MLANSAPRDYSARGKEQLMGISRFKPNDVLKFSQICLLLVSDR